MGIMASSRICLDTDVIIDYLSGYPEAVINAAVQYDAYITTVTLFELEATTFLTQHQRQLLQRIYLAINVIPLDELAARRAAQVSRELRTKGIKASPKESFIAGVCLTENLPLMTRNERVFRQVEGLQIITPAEMQPGLN